MKSAGTQSSGFTLVELIVYIAILGFILAALLNMAYIIQSTRFRSRVTSDIHAAASQIFTSVDFLVRNSDGFVQDINGNDCNWPKSKVWLYFATSSRDYLPPGCAGDYMSTAVSIEQAGTTGSEPGAESKIVNDGTYSYAIYGATITKRYLSDLSHAIPFGDNGVVTMTNITSSVAIVLRDGYLYIFGSGGPTGVEKRLASTGALDSSFDSDGFVTTAMSGTALGGMAVDSNYIYLTASDGSGWYIDKKNKSTGATCVSSTYCAAGTFGTAGILSKTGIYWTVLRDIAIDGTYMYLIGDYSYHTGGIPGTDHFGSTIEKRYLSDGHYDTGFNSLGLYPGSMQDTFSAIGTAVKIDLADTYLYVMGSASSGTSTIRKLAIATGSVSCSRNGIFSDVMRALDVDSSYIYAAADSYIYETNIGDCSAVSTNFGSTPNGYIAVTNTSSGISVSGTYLYVATGATTDKRSVLTGALVSNRVGARLVCYQNYPHVGLNDDCSADPQNSHIQMFDLVDSSRVNIASGNLSFATTTTGSHQAIQTNLSVGFNSAGLPANFSVPTYMASSTSAFRIEP